jgi:uncharacterized membrane protein
MMWIVPSLLSALTQSGYDYFSKKKLQTIDEYTVSFASFIFTIPIMIILVFFIGMPSLTPKFLPAVIISGILNTVAIILFLKSIKISPLSLSIPMLAFTPVLMLIASPLILNEFPSNNGIFGIVLITTGAYLLYFNKISKDVLLPFRKLSKERGALLMLLVAIIYSVAANIDKVGVVSSNFTFYILSLNIFLSVSLGIIMLLKKRRGSTIFIKNIKNLSMLGVLQASTQIFSVIAITMTIVPYLIAVRRTSIFFSSFLGFVGFKERHIVQRSISISIMITGVFILVLF